MSFAEALTVTRNEPLPDVVNAVHLAPFTAEQAAAFIPVQPDDPALKFMSPNAVEHYQKDPERLTADYANAYNMTTWGVHVADEMVGIGSLWSAVNGRAGAELLLAPPARGKRVGELAMVGMLNAAFARDYLKRQDPDQWRRTPRVVEAEIRSGNLAAMTAAKRFGFWYESRRLAADAPNFFMKVYSVHSGLLDGTDKRVLGINNSTRKLHQELSRFEVVAHGRTKIPRTPNHLLSRLG
jgi:RimJ/RimL family protein N-acetyltransferase